MTRTEQEILDLAASVLPGQGAPMLGEPLSMEEVCGVLARRVIALEAAVYPSASVEEILSAVESPQTREAIRKMLGLDS